jgi:hypothetical protein
MIPGIKKLENGEFESQETCMCNFVPEGSIINKYPATTAFRATKSNRRMVMVRNVFI